MAPTSSPLMIGALSANLGHRLGLDRLHWAGVLAILAGSPLIGVALVKAPLVRESPGALFVAIGIVISYYAGAAVGFVALAEILATVLAIGLQPQSSVSTSAVALAVLAAASAGVFLSRALARERGSRAAAEESEERYRGLLEAAFEAVVLTVGGVIVDVNAGSERLTGLSRHDMVGHPILEFLEPESKDAARDYIVSDANGPIELVVSAGERRGRIVRIVSHNVVYEGQPARISAIDDITERRDAEDDRAATEARYRALFESALVAVTIASIDGVYLEANNVFCTLVRRPREDVVGHHYTEFFGPPDPGDFDVLEAILAGDDGPFSFEKRVIDSDGVRIPVRMSVALVRDERDDPLYTVTVLESIAEQRRLEDQILRAQKMEAIGQLAGGIAHDFNNLLTVIGGNVTLLTSGELSDEGREYAAEISGAAERAGAMTRQLLTFSRKQDLSLTNVDANAVVQGAQQLLGRLLGPAVEIELDLEPALAHVLADARQLEQVVVNLAVNAGDAMPEGGQLTISTAAEGAAVLVRVADTGTGMDDATRERIFEPFFTTKDSGEGAGLGLSIVYGIVRQSNGRIRVDSVLGEGTTFTVTLPAADVGQEGRAAPSAGDPVAPSGRRGRVLLVDDETGVRKVAGRALARVGHELVLAGSGQEALDLLEDRQPIDMLVTDLAMPGMNGLELAERVRELHPGVAVLYISGYADQVLASVPADGSLEVLEKPFTPAALAERVARALADR